MALEIKILDYGDIELESSFLVLGRDCGRTRRVPTLGFLVLGGTWPVVIDTGYRSNQIMETLGMRGLQSHENMIENQLKKHGARASATCATCCTRICTSTMPARTTSFPMNTAVVLNRRELEYSVSGLMHPQYPVADIKHLIDRLHTKGALRFLDLEISGPIELMPGLICEAAGGHTEGSMNVHRQDRGRRRDDLRRRDLRHQRPDRRTFPRNQRHGAARHRQSRRDQAAGEGGDQEAVSPRRASCCRSTTGRRMIEARPGCRPSAGRGAGPVVQSLPRRNWFPA